MTLPRTILVYLVLCLILVGQLADVVADSEHWPFSRYAMFASKNFDSPGPLFELRGVTAAGDEAPLRDRRLLEPFHHRQLVVAFENLTGRYTALDQDRQTPPGTQAQVEAALADVLARARRRQAGLVALRLYRGDELIAEARAP